MSDTRKEAEKILREHDKFSEEIKRKVSAIALVEKSHVCYRTYYDGTIYLTMWRMSTHHVEHETIRMAESMGASCIILCCPAFERSYDLINKTVRETMSTVGSYEFPKGDVSHD